MSKTWDEINRRKQQRNVSQPSMQKQADGGAIINDSKEAVEAPKYSLLDAAEIKDPAKGMPRPDLRTGYNPEMPYPQQRTSLAAAAGSPTIAPKITPEEQRKWMESLGVKTPTKEDEEAQRTRRNNMALGWQSLAQGLSALSNLYYTTKGAPNQPLKDYVSPAYDKVVADNERRRVQDEAIQRQKEEFERKRKETEDERKWQLNLYNIKQEAAAAQREQTYKNQAELAKLRSDLQSGRISQQQSNAIQRLIMAGKQKEAAQMRNRAIQESLIRIRKSYSGGGTTKYGDTARDDSGGWWNRTKTVSKNTMEQIVREYGEDLDMDQYRKLVKDPITGKMTNTGAVDWQEAYNDIINNGYVPGDVLRQIGFTKASADDTTPSASSTKPAEQKKQGLGVTVNLSTQTVTKGEDKKNTGSGSGGKTGVWNK